MLLDLATHQLLLHFPAFSLIVRGFFIILNGIFQTHWKKKRKKKQKKKKSRGFQVDNEGDIFIMMAELQSSPTKSAAGQHVLGNGFKISTDIFRQSKESVLTDERHRSD